MLAMAKRLQAMAKADIAAGRNPGQKRMYLNVINERGQWSGEIGFSEEAISIPLKRRKAETYFVNSMSDLFHELVPDPFIDQVFATMVAASRHTFQVLTKQIGRAHV